MKRLTIYDIKRLTAETSPKYFDRGTLKFFGQRMSDFKVSKCDDGRYFISAPVRMHGKQVSTSERFFNPVTNELE